MRMQLELELELALELRLGPRMGLGMEWLEEHSLVLPVWPPY